MEDICQVCQTNKVEFVAYCEARFNTYGTETRYVCAECLEKIKAGLIDSWTKAEWLNL